MTDAKTQLEASAGSSFAKSIEGALYIFGTLAGVRLADIPKQNLWVQFVIALSILLRFSIGARNHLAIEYASIKGKSHPAAQMLLDMGFLMTFAGLLAIATGHLLSPYASDGQTGKPTVLLASQDFFAFLVAVPQCAVSWACISVLLGQPPGSCSARILPLVAFAGNTLIAVALFCNIARDTPFTWPTLYAMAVSVPLNGFLFWTIRRSRRETAIRWSQWILIDTASAILIYTIGVIAKASLLETPWLACISFVALGTTLWDLLYVFSVVKSLASEQ